MNKSILNKIYEVDSLIGKGSYGNVYSVKDEFGNIFAMKTFINANDVNNSDYGIDDSKGNGLSNLSNSLSKFCSNDSDNSDNSVNSDDSEEEQDFTIDLGALRELSTLSMFSKCFKKTPDQQNLTTSHPNIMEILDIIIDGRKIYMIMPKLKCDLTDSLNEHFLTMDNKIMIAYQLLHCVNFLHKNNIIHRDIKSDNILIDDNLRPVLADFSISKIFGDNERGNGFTHTPRIGTHTYKAPEVYNNMSYDKSADVYALGIVFLEMFNGVIKTNKDKIALKYIERVLQQLNDKPIPSLLKRMMDFNPETRITCEDALNLPLFNKVKKISELSNLSDVKYTKNITNKQTNQNITVNPPKKKKNNKKSKRNDFDRYYRVLKCRNPLTKLAAAHYHHTAKTAGKNINVLHCMFLASKTYEEELLSTSHVENLVNSFDTSQYIKDEILLFQLCDFCLFI